jgi:histone-lysine N-methyltransferase SETMAR
VDGKRVSSTKTAKISPSKFKVILVVLFDYKNIVHYEFVPRGQMVNRQLYQEVLACLRDVVRRGSPELWENETWMYHHDSAPAHALQLIRSCLAKEQTCVVPHPPYSPDLAPADFFLYTNHKTTLK